MERETIGDALSGALETIAVLAALGEAIEDELVYVTDLVAAWTARLDVVAAARGGERLPTAVDAALEAAGAEVALIEDPHRAIDWLSTYPQLVLLALGERP